MCNNNHLNHNYVKVIDDFSNSWYKLAHKYNLSTTPKIHIILDHLCDYFDDCEVTLKTVTDELVENIHQYVEKTMVRSGYKVKHLLNPNHGLKLYNAVIHINCYNLRLQNGTQLQD